MLAGHTYNVTVLNAKGAPLRPQPVLTWAYSDIRAGPNCEDEVSLLASNITQQQPSMPSR